MTEWRDHADGYGGGFLRIYAKVATLSGDAQNSVELACLFATGFGNLITLADHLRDYSRTGERTGNLAALVIEDRITVDEVIAYVNEMKDVAMSGCSGGRTAFDLEPTINLYTSDILSRMIPELQSQRATAKVSNR